MFIHIVINNMNFPSYDLIRFFKFCFSVLLNKKMHWNIYQSFFSILSKYFIHIWLVIFLKKGKKKRTINLFFLWIQVNRGFIYFKNITKNINTHSYMYLVYNILKSTIFFASEWSVYYYKLVKYYIFWYCIH